MGSSKKPMGTRGPKNSEGPRLCCQAMTAGCLSCKMDITIEELCARKPEVDGCENRPLLNGRRNLQNVCDCETRDAACVACKMGMTVEELCRQKPDLCGSGNEKPMGTDKPGTKRPMGTDKPG